MNCIGGDIVYTLIRVRIMSDVLCMPSSKIERSLEANVWRGNELNIRDFHVIFLTLVQRVS